MSAKARTNILLVDDNVVFRHALSSILSSRGYFVGSAEDGAAALTYVETKIIPDIVVSDLNMPRLSGFQFLPSVRDRYPTVQTVAMSSQYVGSQVPPGVVADAYYSKREPVLVLLAIVDLMARRQHPDAVLRGTIPDVIPDSDRKDSQHSILLLGSV